VQRRVWLVASRGECGKRNMNNISEEIKLRTLIRKAIKFKLEQNKQNDLLEENQLRKVIRHYILEAKEIDADKNPAPYSSTALSTLAEAFNEILKTVKDGLRGLSRPEERLSYRMNMLHLFQRSFKRFEGFDGPPDVESGEGGVMGEGDIMEQEEESLKVKLDLPDSAMVMPADGSEDDKFKQKEVSDEDKAKEEFEQERVGGTDETGAMRAFHTWNNSNVEQTLSDARQLLPRPEDKQEFKEYCLYNIDLWTLQYEKEIAQEKGQEMAYTETIMPRPAGAEVKPQVAEFETGGIGGEIGEGDLSIPTFR